MSKPEVTVRKKNLTLRETRLKGESILIWVRPDSVIINHIPSIMVYYMVKRCGCITRKLILVVA